MTGVWLGNDDGTPTKKITGGGLPVDIWSKFMKPAHQGVAVAALPGMPAAAALPRIVPPIGPLAPPMAVPNSEAPVRPVPTGGGIDDWLLDRLFGRR